MVPEKVDLLFPKETCKNNKNKRRENRNPRKKCTPLGTEGIWDIIDKTAGLAHSSLVEKKGGDPIDLRKKKSQPGKS